MAFRTVLRAKIHRARVTDSDLNYEGSLSLGRELMKAAGICEFEKVAVFNISNGARFETYAIGGEAGEVKANGAAARLAKKGDIVIIVSYAIVEESEAESAKPRIIRLDSSNKIVVE